MREESVGKIKGIASWKDSLQGYVEHVLVVVWFWVGGEAAGELEKWSDFPLVYYPGCWAETHYRRGSREERIHEFVGETQAKGDVACQS